MNTNYISEEEKQVCEFLINEGQQHLLENLTKFSNQDRQNFVDQIKGFDKTYPGGLGAYIRSARKLLKDSSENVNPYQDYVPSIPAGQSVDFYNTKELHQLEAAGLAEIKSACFVLVAGGLGERLGYDSIKIEIPIEVVTNTTFIQYYCEYILAFQEKSGADEIPLAIMVSDDTHDLTVKILQENNYFGMKKDQITIMKQDKVPVFGDITAKMCLKNENTLLLDTKPHGHGDVHMLLHLKGLAEKWRNMGKKWVLFFQDTNPLAFRAFPSVFGVSKKFNLEVNSITIPRKPGEAVGAICKLTNSQGKNLTLNVEYNQLEGLFKNLGGEPVDSQGYSLYPGNINCLIFSLPEYCKTLSIHEGRIAEFVNPKYKDSTKTTFTTPTRLECMMQDYPKLLENGDRVGITQIDRRFCFSTVKNDLKSAAAKFKSKLAPESASSCEYDFYWCNGELLKLCETTIENLEQQQTYQGIGFNTIPKIVLKPSFGVTVQEIQSKIKGKVNISAFSTLIIDGDISIENLDLNGSLFASNNIKDVSIQDKNYIGYSEINVADPNLPSYLAIRGYKVSDNLKDMIKM